MTHTETPAAVKYAISACREERRRATDLFEGNMQEWRAHLESGDIDKAAYDLRARFEAKALLARLEEASTRCDDAIEEFYNPS